MSHMCVRSLQAYAFASGARVITGKDHLMNMLNFDKSIWILHRKLFHRFIKYYKFFKKATLVLPEYQQAIVDVAKAGVINKKTRVKSASKERKQHHIVTSLTTSSEEVSEESAGEANDSEISMGEEVN